MLDVLKKNVPSKIVNISSEAHRFPKTLDISRLHLQRSKFDEFIVYGESKLCINLFTNKLSYLFKGLFKCLIYFILMLYVYNYIFIFILCQIVGHIKINANDFERSINL